MTGAEKAQAVEEALLAVHVGLDFPDAQWVYCGAAGTRAKLLWSEITCRACAQATLDLHLGQGWVFNGETPLGRLVINLGLR